MAGFWFLFVLLVGAIGFIIHMIKLVFWMIKGKWATIVYLKEISTEKNFSKIIYTYEVLAKTDVETTFQHSIKLGSKNGDYEKSPVKLGKEYKVLYDPSTNKFFEIFNKEVILFALCFIAFIVLLGIEFS